MAARSVDDLNRDSPLRAAFFEYDSAELTAEARAALDADAATLKKYRTWAVTIEGHCDERGTAEYNLALGERRAVGGAVVPGVARHARRPPEDGQLRQGVPVRPRSRRGGVREEPARAFRHHRQVARAGSEARP